MKTIILQVFSSKTPCFLKIFSSDGLLLKKFQSNNNFFKVCFCTCSNYVLCKITHNNETEQKYVGLFENKCQKQNVSFSFLSEQTFVQTFVLTDQNFGLPIPNAVLKFKN